LAKRNNSSFREDEGVAEEVSNKLCKYIRKRGKA